MSFVKDGWEKDFPRVMHFFDRKDLYGVPSILLKKLPDYAAAKWKENPAAAARLVLQLVDTQENITQLCELKEKYQDAILAAVIAEEAGGKNKLPYALREYIAKKAEFTVDIDIVQSNKVFHTGASDWHRLAFRPEFAGNVKSGRRYILLDDVCAPTAAPSPKCGTISKKTAVKSFIPRRWHSAEATTATGSPPLPCFKNIWLTNSALII